MRLRTLTRLLPRSTSHCPVTPTPTVRSIHSSALSQIDKQKVLAQHKTLAKSDYERIGMIRAKANRKLKQQLEAEKPVHHLTFSRVFFKPNFPDKYEPTDMSKCNAYCQIKPKPFQVQRTGVIAQKVGMTTLFDATGVQHPITILKMDAVQVVLLKGIQNRRRATFNMQLGYGSELIENVKWRELGTFNAHKVCPKKKIMDFQCGHKALIKPGTEISCRHFMVGQFVDIQGVSRDKGFQGVMKRWSFKGGPATHGSSKFHRRRGSMGAGSGDPGKVWKGKRMPGHMGKNNFTQQKLLVFRIEPKHNLLYVKGPVAGLMDDFVRVRDCHFFPPIAPPFPTFIPDPNETELPEGEEWPGRHKNLLWNRDPNMDDWLDDRVTKDLP